MDISPMLIN